MSSGLFCCMCLCRLCTAWCRRFCATAVRVHNQWMAYFVGGRFGECILSCAMTRRWANAWRKRSSSAFAGLGRLIAIVAEWICRGTRRYTWRSATGPQLRHVRAPTTGETFESRSWAKALANDAFECEPEIFREQRVNHWIDGRITVAKPK